MIDILTRRGFRLVSAATLGASVLCAAPSVWAGPVSFPAAVATDPTAVRGEIQELLRRMVIAVAAADQDGYMACVSQTDPVFTMEQRNWAKDLGRKAPESFDASLGEEDPEPQPDGSVKATLKMVWRMPGAKDRSIEYPARFVRGESGWLYAGEWWNEFGGERVLVFYEDESLKEVAQAVAEVLPSIREHVHEGFQLEGDKDLTERVQQVKLYTTVKHLQHSIYLSYKDGLGGWNEPGESIKILARPGTPKGSLRVVLSHEYGHVATFQLGPKATDMPWWILEGVAEMSAEKYSRGGERTDRTVERWFATDKIVDWDKLADFHGEAANHYASVYTQGHHMIRYISGRFGRESRNAWMAAMAKGATLDEATRRVLNLPFSDLDAQWRESLKEAVARREAEESKGERKEGEDKPSPSEPSKKP